MSCKPSGPTRGPRRPPACTQSLMSLAVGGLALSRERVHDPRQQRTLAGVVQGGLWSSSLGVVEDHRIGIISCRRDVAREEQGLLKVRTSRTGCVEPFPAKTPPVLGSQLLIEGLSRLSRNQVIRCLAHLGAVISAGSCHGEENVPETCPKTATVLMQAQRASREDPTHLVCPSRVAANTLPSVTNGTDLGVSHTTQPTPVAH